MRSTTARDGLSGATAAAVALGISELAAGLLGLPSLIEGMGNWVIDMVPTPVKEWAIATFGTNDKLVLLIGIVVVTILLGALVGVVARDRFGIAIAVFIGFAAAASLAALNDPSVSLGVAVIPAGLAAITGLVTLQWLYSRNAEPGRSQAESDDPQDVSRRGFVIGVVALFGLAAVSGGIGRALVDRTTRSASGRADVALPAAAEGLPEVPQAAELGVEGLSSVITPNEVFYRIDTAFLGVPRVDIQEWALTIEGRVDTPYSLSYFDLLDMRLVEKDVTLSCVSNEVGGDLVGNARWLGVPLAEVLDRAGVQEDAEQLVGRSVDDFTVGFPVEAVYDGRDALIAVGMNGEPLPMEHGFPARLVVAGLYGYVSATKWLSSIELTGWEDFDAYWIPRGWAKEAPIKTQSRIDTPTQGASMTPGARQVAGVAWAPHRGISRVEVRLGEDAEWVEARLAEPLSDNCWRQWVVDWDAEVGTHQLQVRATDGEGNVQTDEHRPPAPDGATGWHTIQVSVG
ncbi:MAG TPA: molybdopterin-dependent oxidoreductase [Acidimicrobiia bacterium]|jgi:DMSO/TMAO reductase YedYZ molybdopterin-dependent catalytic subunit|nr:molybdopterin-dependent oxidoreductase [Acidimicrobiia bacterium]